MIEFLFAITAFVSFIDAIDRKDKENIKPKQPQIKATNTEKNTEKYLKLRW